jgi:hypothetical protein
VEGAGCEMQDGGALDGRRRMEGAESRCRMKSIGQKVQNGRCRIRGAGWGEGIGGEGWAGSDSLVRPHFLEPFDSLPLTLSLPLPISLTLLHAFYLSIFLLCSFPSLPNFS